MKKLISSVLVFALMGIPVASGIFADKATHEEAVSKIITLIEEANRNGDTETAKIYEEALDKLLKVSDNHEEEILKEDDSENFFVDDEDDVFESRSEINEDLLRSQIQRGSEIDEDLFKSQIQRSSEIDEDLFKSQIQRYSEIDEDLFKSQIQIDPEDDEVEAPSEEDEIEILDEETKGDSEEIETDIVNDEEAKILKVREDLEKSMSTTKKVLIAAGTIAVIVGAGYAAYTYCPAVQEFVNGQAANLGEIAGTAKEAITPYVNTALDSIKDYIISPVSSMFNSVKGWFSKNFQTIS